MAQNVWDDNEDEFIDNPAAPEEGGWEKDSNGEWVPSGNLKATVSPQAIAAIQQDPPKTTKKIAPDFSSLAKEPEPQFEDAVEEYGTESLEQEEESEDFEAVLSNASLRLEQGHLYQMVMNHQLFQGLDASPIAIKNVEKEIRKFAKERMEIMLGMRQEKVQAPVQQSVPSQFNDLEVIALKQFAYKLTEGKSAEAPPIQSRMSLNSIGSTGQSARPQSPKPITQKTTPKPLQAKPTQPLRRTKESAPVEKILREEGVSRQELEEDYKPLTKPLAELSPAEQAKRIRESQERLSKLNRRADNPNKVPMPSYEQQEAQAMALASKAAGPSSSVGRIIQTLNNKK